MRFFPAVLIPTGITLLFLAAGPAEGEEHYLLHEKLEVGQVVRVESDYHRHVRTVTTTGSTTTPSDVQYHQMIDVTINVLAVTDGSATAMRVHVDPSSHDTRTDSKGLKAVDNSFAGKTVTLRRLADGTVANDYSGQADAVDQGNINAYLNPDADCYPDNPVAVGEVWDASAKISKHADLGPGDQLMAQCRLDGVNTIDGRQIANISCNCGEIFQEEGNVEEDVQWSSQMQVDIAAGQIIYSDSKGTSTYSTPASEPTRVTGDTNFHYVDKVVPATQP
jgi:hypothetical protein